MSRLTSPRVGGAWGIAFVILLLASAAMASLPNATHSDAAIAAFYKENTAIIVVQQVVGALALVPFVLFALSLDRNRWLRPAMFLVVTFELLTNMVPLIIIAAPGAAHSLTVVEDLADSALFAAIAFFVIAATLAAPLWLRLPAYIVAAGAALQAIASPFGVTALNLAAPLAFIAFVLLLSVLKIARGANTS